MSLPSVQQWDEDRKTYAVVYDHSRAKPVEKKYKFKKSRQAAFKDALTDRTKPSRQHQHTKTKTKSSDSSRAKEQCGAQAKRNEASSPRPKETHHMIQIFINTPFQPKNLCLRLDHKTTVFNLKEIIQSKFGIPLALQILLTKKPQFKLCDALSLLDLGIEPETNIELHLSVGLLGGAPTPKRTVDETFLRNLAGKLGTDWQPLARKLGFTSAEIGKFESHAEGNPEEQAFQMLDSWWKKQPDGIEAREWLRSALFQTGHQDLTAEIPGSLAEHATATSVKSKTTNPPRRDQTDFQRQPRAPHESQTAKSESIHHSKGDKSDPETKQHSTVEGTLSEISLLRMAGLIGTDWKPLATHLGFEETQIHAFQHDNRDNLQQQAFKMLVAWKKKLTNEDEWKQTLTKCLHDISRNDLVSTLAAPRESQTAKSETTHNSKGDKSDPETKQHSKVEGTLSEIFLDKMARSIGKDWKRLATHLEFEEAQKEAFEYENRDNLQQQAFKMLVAWKNTLTNEDEGKRTLIKCLNDIGRNYLASTLTGVMGPPFNIEACGKTLVSHYKETMKVNTQPLSKDKAFGMDELYVNLELLQETNRPKKPTTLQSDNKNDCTMHRDVKSECEVDKTKTEHEKNPLKSYEDMLSFDNKRKTKTEYESIPLKSYEDMLSFDKNRILITAESGYGKSTLLKKIAYDWAVLQNDTHLTHQKQESPLSKYKHIFLLEINKMKGNFNIMDEIVSQILPQNEFKKQDIENYITRHQDEVLILLDGADEISFQAIQNAKEDFSVYNVLSFKSLKCCKVIVTSRESTALKLLDCNPNFTRIDIVRFDDKNKQEYIRKYFNDSKDHDRVFNEVNKSETLRSLGEIPLFLWLMCSFLSQERSLPDRITELVHDATSILYQQKISKDCKTKPSEAITKTRFNELMAKLGQVALEGFPLEGLMLKGDGKHSFEASDFDSEDDVNLGCEVGLLTRVQHTHGIEQVERVQFYHMIIMQFCCSVYLSDLADTNPDKFNVYLSRLLEGDVDRIGYLIRFCSGRNKKAAECVIELLKKHLSVYNNKTAVECERYVCLHRIMMLALFESKLGSMVKTLRLDQWVRFPYELKGEDLLAAHYFIQNLPKRSMLPHASDLTITCQRKTDLNILEQIMARAVCNSLSLQVVGVNMNDQMNVLRKMSKFVTSLTLSDCQLGRDSVPKIFKAFKSPATKLKIMALSGNNLHGLKSEQIPRIPSLEILVLARCKLEKNDIGPLFTIVAAAGSIKTLILNNNELHGIQNDQIAASPSLNVLGLDQCSLQSEDIGPLFSIIAAAGSVHTVLLSRNDLYGIQGDQITPVPSLRELIIKTCNLQSNDIGPLFSIVAAAGRITTVVLDGNDLHGIQGNQITPVPSLRELIIKTCNLQSNDIGPLFSIVAAAGSIRHVGLNGNDLHGLQVEQITPVSSLNDLSLDKCNLQSNDIGPLFSLVAAAGSIQRVGLDGNDLHGIQGDQITPVPSLEFFSIEKCNLQSNDIGPLFSLIAAAGSITRVDLNGNNLHGIQNNQINAVHSLRCFHLQNCNLQSNDIEPLFSVVAAAGSIWHLDLNENDLHGIQRDQINAASSLNKLSLEKCHLQSNDIGPLFFIVAAAGSLTSVVLSGNDLHGIQSDQITPVSSLEYLGIKGCNLQGNDIGQLFSVVAAAGSITKLVLNENNLVCFQGDQITPVLSLEDFVIQGCNLQSNDIGPLFSVVAAAGSVKKVELKGIDLHGIQSDQITPVSSLEYLGIQGCNLQSNDIGPLFSLVAAAGSISSVALEGNNLHGIQSDQITPAPSLENLGFQGCNLQSNDIGPLFSIVAAAGNIKKVVLIGNDLHGIQSDQITPVSSLEVFFIMGCNLQSDDIGPLFSIVAAAGNIKTVLLTGSDLHGIKSDQITPVSSLEDLFIPNCNLQSNDIGPLFFIVAAAGSVKKLVLDGNDLHGIHGDHQICPVPSLEELSLKKCNLQSNDSGPLSSVVAAAGSITTVLLGGNDLQITSSTLFSY